MIGEGGKKIVQPRETNKYSYLRTRLRIIEYDLGTRSDNLRRKSSQASDPTRGCGGTYVVK
jgi:hypothetical protein